MTAKIEDGKKKIRQFGNQEKCYDRSCPLRNARRETTGLIVRAASYGSIIVWKYR